MWLLIVFSLYAVLLSVLLARAGHRAQPSAANGGEAAVPERLLIVGATGGTGRQLVVQALERGYRVTALARRPGDLNLEHPRLSVVRGDVLDAVSLAAATQGQDAVLCALGHRRFLYPTRILSRGTANLLAAMATHADVAEFMLDQLTSNTYLRTAPGVCNR